MMKIPRPRLRSNAAPIAGVAALVVVAGLVALSAPSSRAPRVTLPQRSQGNASATVTPAKVARVGQVSTPAPTPIDTPTPELTATPVPPTPTPAPSWHVQGSYSGSAAGVVATFNNPGSQVRIDWSCRTTQSLPTWQIAFGIEHYAGEGEQCQPGQTNGSFTLSAPRTTVTLDVSGGCSGTGCPPIGPWTATVYVWY